MAKANIPYVSFNGGEVGAETILRIDQELYRSVCERMENWLPTIQGEMDFRPGTKFIQDFTDYGTSLLYPFVYNVADSAILVISDENLSIVLNDGVISRPSVTCSITNGTFATATGWTDTSDIGGVVTFVTNALEMSGDGSAVAKITQAVTTSSVGIEHAIRLKVTRGPITFKIGTTSGGSEIFSGSLYTGIHSLAFIPSAATFHVEFSTYSQGSRVIHSIAIESAGDLAIDTPWSGSDLQSLRFCQSHDVMFVASPDSIVKRIERRGAGSWSLTDFEFSGGPFGTVNSESSHTLAPDVIKGVGTLTSSRDLFESGHVGSLWKISHNGQVRSGNLSSGGSFVGTIQISGAGNGRIFQLDISGTWVGTITVQRSIGNEISWEDVATLSYTSNVSKSIDDNLDNQIIYYRAGFKTGDYTSGTAAVALSFGGGSTDGVARITSVTSSTVADIEVVSEFSAVSESSAWAEGEWSGVRGWPTCVARFDGRLFYSRDDQFWATVSGTFDNFRGGEDDADSISRDVASGNANPIVWILGMQRLIFGTEGAEASARSSSFDQPLTPTDITIRDASTIGSANVMPLRVDKRGLFVDRSGIRLYEIYYIVDEQDYASRPLTRMHVDVGRPSITQIAVTRQPHSRVWCIRGDGQCLVLLYDPSERVMGWSRLVTDGVFESVAVLPPEESTAEDRVYFIVRRTINGSTVRYLEKMAPTYFENVSDVRRMDSYLDVEEETAFSVVSGLDHLEGKEVVILGDGSPHSPKTVVSGEVDLDRPCNTAAVGLPYTAYYKSGVVSDGAQFGTGLAQSQRQIHLRLVLRKTGTSSICYGGDFSEMDRLDDTAVQGGHYDSAFPLFNGPTEVLTIPAAYSFDPRLCLKAQSPLPATVQALVIGRDLHERV